MTEKQLTHEAVMALPLHPLTAWDEVSFSRRLARVVAPVRPDLGDEESALALAKNCVTVFAALRGSTGGQCPPLRSIQKYSPRLVVACTGRGLLLSYNRFISPLQTRAGCRQTAQRRGRGPPRRRMSG